MIWTYKTTVDLDKPNQPSLWKTIASVGNKKAHGFEIRVVKSGVPVDLSRSTVELSARRQDGATRYLQGKISDDNAAVAELDASCYEVEGQLKCTMTLSRDDTVFSAACIYLLIDKADGDAIVDPSHTIPSVMELLEQIEATRASAKDAQDAAAAANTATGNANAAANNANNQAEAAKSAAEAANAAAKNWGNSTAANSEKLGGKAPEYYLQPRNLLDNSDFEIAQAGYGGKHGSTVYAADRWMQNDKTERTYTYTTKNGHGALKCSTATRIQQKLHLVDGQNYTAAFYINDTLYILNFTANGADNGSGAIWVNKQSDGTYMFIVSSIPAGGIVYEPVLYIGTYTADTLPPYVPKGYAQELAECQQRYHVYATENARPSHALDCCPQMILAPGQTVITQGTLTVDGKTLYYNSTDL